MKTKNILKIILDIVMSVLYIVLLFPSITGFAFHEITGLSIIGLFVAHLVLNRKWIVGVSKSLFNNFNSVTSKTIFSYALSVGLLLGVIVIFITGIIISGIILPVHNYSYSFTIIHRWASYFTAAMLALHLALHFKYILLNIKKILLNKKDPVIKKFLSAAFAILLISSIVYYNIIAAVSKNSKPGNISVNNNSQNMIITPSQSTAETDKEELTVNPSDNPAEAITLSEFLSKLFCNLCPRHCPLSSPQCGKSRTLIANATEEYNTTYKNNED